MGQRRELETNPDARPSGCLSQRGHGDMLSRFHELPTIDAMLKNSKLDLGSLGSQQTQAGKG